MADDKTTVEVADSPALELTPEEQRFFQTGGVEGPGENYLTEEEKGTIVEPDIEPIADPADEPAALKEAPKGDGPDPEAEADAPSDDADGDGQIDPEEEDRPEPELEGDIPHNRFHKERERRKAAEARITGMEEQQRRMEERFAEVVTRFARPQAHEPAAPAEPAEEVPDRETNPMEYLEYQIAQLKKGQEATQQTAQKTVEQTQITRFATWADNAEREFAASTPDYDGAVQHMKEMRAQDLRSLGYDDQSIAHSLNQEAQAIAVSAFQNGQNPAEIVYNMAKRYGFKGTAAGASSPARTPAAPVAVPPAARMATLKAGERAGNNLGGPGGEAPDTVSLADVANLPDDEFTKYWDKLVSSNSE